MLRVAAHAADGRPGQQRAHLRQGCPRRRTSEHGLAQPWRRAHAQHRHHPKCAPAAATCTPRNCSTGSWQGSPSAAAVQLGCSKSGAANLHGAMCIMQPAAQRHASQAAAHLQPCTPMLRLLSVPCTHALLAEAACACAAIPELDLDGWTCDDFVRVSPGCGALAPALCRLSLL